MNNDVISREALKEDLFVKFGNQLPNGLLEEIDNAPTVEAYSLEDMQNNYDAGATHEAAKHDWIPIKMRPGTDEEYEEFSQYGDCPREDFRVFDCPLPDDDQEVLVTTRWGDVCIDIWHRDVDCCYFENNCDDDDVIAWMPKPEGYKSEVQDADN